ncbi:MAG: hypothetical protein K2G91_00840 [Prevotella sp.]|nr:hypothetical protein [Prevotella sp.]
MKKRLLLSLMAMCMAVAGFALSNGEFVYTPQGRFQITGENLNTNSAFNDFAGWTLVSASADKTLADQFNINGNGAPGGGNSVQCLDATAGEGMYFKFEPTSASDSYVVSFKMKGAALDNTRTKINDGVDENVVKVFGDTDGTYADATDEVVCNTAEELTEDWQTFNYAIVGDGTARTYFISFTSIATTIEIADLQIAPAMQFADLRQRDAMLEKLNTYKNAYNWDAALLDDCGYNEIIAGLEAIGDENGQEELNELLDTANEILTEFLNANMDDYLAGANRDSYFDTWRTKIQKWNEIGAWTVLPVGRGFWEKAEQVCADLGHFQSGSSWGNGAPNDPMGVYMQKEMEPGAYVFSINSRAAVREKAKSCWTDNTGLNVAYGVAYVVKVNEGADPDTIVSLVKGVDAELFTNFTITAKLEENATYEIGFKVYCKEACKGLTYGSVTYIKDASLWGKNNNKYNQKQLGYEADVREQITTGRTNLTTAAENIANADYLWGKAVLQACVDTVEVKIAAYELLSQDDIIATYEEDYVKSTSAETGYLVYTIYQEAVKDIIAANKKFVAVNDTLNSMQAVIDAAEATLGLRIYDAATGKDALKAAIAKAKEVQAQMKAAQYSEENAAAIVAANAALNEAIALFKTTVPASAITTVVDIDFAQDATLSDATGLYSIAGNKGSMEFSTFSTVDATVENAFEQGLWSNGEQLYKNYVRVGNGTGTVTFDPTEAGSMGTNILKVSFDFYLQGLIKRYVGVFLKDELAENNVAAFYANYYDNAIEQNTFGIKLDNLKYGSGKSYDDAAPEGAEGAGSTTCAKNSFEFIFDFGEGSMYATTVSGKGTATTEKMQFDGTVPYSFILQCNYNVASRRPWFNNLKVERIAAGATDKFVPTGIEEVNTADTKVVAPTKVFKNGRIVINGKYGINGMLIK